MHDVGRVICQSACLGIRDAHDTCATVEPQISVFRFHDAREAIEGTLHLRDDRLKAGSVIQGETVVATGPHPAALPIEGGYVADWQPIGSRKISDLVPV